MDESDQGEVIDVRFGLALFVLGLRGLDGLDPHAHNVPARRGEDSREKVKR